MQTTDPTLDRSYKHCFPFRLSVPSFVYPADYGTNARRLGPYVDEIELLLFESDPAGLISAAEIKELADLSTQLDLAYNVHLPLDLDLGALDDTRGRLAVDRLEAIIKRVRPLSPTTHTLHLMCTDKHRVEQWQARTMERLADLLGRVAVPSRCFSIETLEYPPQWLEPIVERLDLSLCIDVGHILLNGFDLEAVLECFSERVTNIHLHGAADGHDHLGLDKLPLEAEKITRRYLNHYRGILTLEIFSLDRLQRSWPWLAERMGPTADG